MINLSIDTKQLKQKIEKLQNRTKELDHVNKRSVDFNVHKDALEIIKDLKKQLQTKEKSEKALRQENENLKKQLSISPRIRPFDDNILKRKQKFPPDDEIDPLLPHVINEVKWTDHWEKVGEKTYQFGSEIKRLQRKKDKLFRK